MKIDREATRKARAEWVTRHGLDPALIVDERPDVTTTLDGLGRYTFRQLMPDTSPPVFIDVTLEVRDDPFPPDLVTVF